MDKRKLAKLAREIHKRKRASEHLLDFTVYTHPRWRTEPHHVKICKYLEWLEQQKVCPHCGRIVNKLANFAPPRSGKTELSLRRFTAWCVGRHPDWNVISAMANGKLASDTGGEIRDIVASPEFAQIFPDVTLQSDAKAADRWVVESGNVRGVFYTAGVDASFPGRGACILNIDDPHKSAQEADSQRMRELVEKFYFGDAVQRLEDPGLQILTNTRRHEEDLAGKILPPSSEWSPTEDPQFFCCDNGWHVLRIRAIENEGTDHEEAIRNRNCPKGGDPLEHMSSIRDLYKSKGKIRYWNSEFQQEPSSDSGLYIKRAWFDERYDELPRDLRVYIWSDYAVTEKDVGNDPDYTEHGVFGVDPENKIYVLDWWSGRTESDVWIESLLDLVEEWKPKGLAVVFGEKGQIAKSVGPFLERRKRERGVYFRLETVASVLDKSARGRSFQALASSGQILFGRQGWAERVIDQCVGFPTTRFDDAFDVMSGMSLCVDNMHPAMATIVDKPEKRDRWQRRKATSGWMGA